MKTLSEMWPVFLSWIDDYVDLGMSDSAKVLYSREDMRYAFQAGYEKAIQEQPINSSSLTATKMIVCSECGNKRCPKASDQRLDCTGSNEPGQPGRIHT